MQTRDYIYNSRNESRIMQANSDLTNRSNSSRLWGEELRNYYFLLTTLVSVTLVIATTPQEFQTACAAMPGDNSQHYLLVMPDNTMVCYLYSATLNDHVNTKTICQTPLVHLGAGEPLVPAFPNRSFLIQHVYSMAPSANFWSAGERLGASGGGATPSTGWFWYDGVAHRSKPFTAADHLIWGPNEPSAGAGSCMAVYWHDNSHATACTNQYHPRVCEYYYTKCDEFPTWNCSSAAAAAAPSSFKPILNVEGTNAILINHSNIVNKVQCALICHMDCRCKAVTYKGDVKHCLLHWASPNEFCFTTVSNSKAMIYYEY